LLLFPFPAFAQTQIAPPEKIRAVQQRPNVNESAPTVVPELYWQLQRTAEARITEAHLQAKIFVQSGSGIVISQDPLPGTKVATGTVVNITIGQPQLLLTAGSPTAKINQNVTFTATLEPPLPKTATPAAMAYVPPQAKYTFNWDDNTQTGPTDSTTVPHSYGTARTYNVTANVQVGKLLLPSNAVTVTVENPVQAPAYSVYLGVDPRTVETGNKVVASVTVKPAPPQGTSYTFVWGDGARETTQSATATHSYGPPAKRHAIQAVVNIRGTEIRSNPVQVQVTVPRPPRGNPPSPQETTSWPTWQIIVAVVIGLAVLIGGYKLIRSGSGKPSPQPQHLPKSLSVVAKPGPVHHEIQQPQRIRVKPSVHIRSGCTSQATMKPVEGIARKRSASNA